MLTIGGGPAPAVTYQVRIDPAANKSGVRSESLTAGAAQYAVRGDGLGDVCPDSVARTRFAQEVSVLSALKKARGDVATDNRDVAEFLSALASIYRYRLVPHLLRQTADDPSGDFVPALGPMGEGLAAVLYQMREYRTPAFDELLDRLGESIIGFKNLEFVSDSSSSNGLRVSIEFDDSRGSVDVNNVSDGTMTTLGLATLVSHPHPPRVALLEEPEMGLSPSATTRPPCDCVEAKSSAVEADGRVWLEVVLSVAARRCGSVVLGTRTVGCGSTGATARSHTDGRCTAASRRMAHRHTTSPGRPEVRLGRDDVSQL